MSSPSVLEGKILALAMGGDMTAGQIAERLGCSISHVTFAKRRARARGVEVPRDPRFGGGGAARGNQYARRQPKPAAPELELPGNAAWQALAD